MRRANRSVCVLLLVVSSVACLSLASESAVAAEEEWTAEHRSSGQVDRAKTRRHCVKRKHAGKAKRRSCRKAKQRRQESLVIAPTQGGSTDVAAPAADTVPSTSPEPPRSSPEPIPEPNEEEPEPPLEETPPKEEPPLPVTRHCELVEGDCSIYSDKFWELLAKYKRFEIGIGTYPVPPECMEAWEKGEPVVCVQIVVSLRPDGTIGGSWVVDPCAPDGWRDWETDAPPCLSSEETVEG